MKALLVNGSPRRNGCTYTALTELAKTLEAEGIEAEIVHVGNKVRIYGNGKAERILFNVTSRYE